MGETLDSALADFTFNVNNQVVSFNASASSGQVFYWNFGDGTTGGLVTTQHTYNQLGTYTVTLTVTDTVCNTVDTMAQTVDITIGIAEERFENSLKLYPNPSNGQFEVSFELMNKGNVNLGIVNLLGEPVYTEDLDYQTGSFSKTLDLSHLSKGVYLINFRLNNTISTRRIVIQ